MLDTLRWFLDKLLGVRKEEKEKRRLSIRIGRELLHLDRMVEMIANGLPEKPSELIRNKEPHVGVNIPLPHTPIKTNLMAYAEDFDQYETNSCIHSQLRDVAIGIEQYNTKREIVEELLKKTSQMSFIEDDHLSHLDDESHKFRSIAFKLCTFFKKTLTTLENDFGVTYRIQNTEEK